MAERHRIEPAKPTLHNAWGHFRTITRHKFKVMGLCFRVGLYAQGLKHDLSKYTPVEFMAGARYFKGDRSPNAVERDVTGVSAAWMHHKGRNRHHFEYWMDLGFTDEAKTQVEFEGKPMPTRYVVEMFCDRIAACKVYQGSKYTDSSPLNYFLSKPDSRFMHPDTAKLLLKMLKLLARVGERTALSLVKRDIVKARYTQGRYGRF